MNKYSKVSIFFVLVVMFAVSLAGCASPAPAATTAAPVSAAPASQADSKIDAAIKALDPNRGQGKTIGVVAFFQANDWNRNALKAITDNFEKYKYTVNIIDGNGDPCAGYFAHPPGIKR